MPMQVTPSRYISNFRSQINNMMLVLVAISKIMIMLYYFHIKSIIKTRAGPQCGMRLGLENKMAASKK